MTKLRHAGEFFSPHPGLYLPIPPQFRSWGVIPGTDLIDIYMRALGRRYYVALLSAAELWGAAHQRPQTFQVVVDKPIADKDFDRVKLRFYTSARAATVATVERSSAAGRYYVSSPAVTLLDVADRPRECGGVNNVATVVHELASEQKIDGHELAGQALRFRRSAARRLGWLLAETGARLTWPHYASSPLPPQAHAEQLCLTPPGHELGAPTLSGGSCSTPKSRLTCDTRRGYHSLGNHPAMA